jgi:hypothetical protein
MELSIKKYMGSFETHGDVVFRTFLYLSSSMTDEGEPTANIAPSIGKIAARKVPLYVAYA